MINVIYLLFAVVYTYKYSLRVGDSYPMFMTISASTLLYELYSMEVRVPAMHNLRDPYKFFVPPSPSTLPPSTPRNYVVKGPMTMFYLPDRIKSEFLSYNLIDWKEPMLTNMGSKNVGKQIPSLLLPHLEEIKNGIWSQTAIDTLVTANLAGKDISPEVYPTCALQLKKAIKTACKDRQRVLIAGSISPWVESVLLASGINFDVIDTTDYNPIEIADKRLGFVPIEQVRKNYYDVVISYSSLEHDGLGRYGDPINPNGDIAAVEEYHSYLRSGGLFLLGLPVTKTNHGYIVGNGHRIYSKERIQRLKEVGFVETTRIEPFKSGTMDWQNQPVMIWGKK